MDLWARQENYVEVWVEKEALIGVLEGVCTELDVPYFACSGYTSQSEMWGASQRLIDHEKAGKKDCPSFIWATTIPRAST